MSETDDDTRPKRTGDSALGRSVPDFNAMVMAQVRYLFKLGRERPYLAPIAWTIGAALAFAMVLFVVGLPVINGSTIWYDKHTEAQEAERQFELQRLRVQAEIDARGATPPHDPIAEDAAAARQAAEATELNTRTLSEDVQRLDHSVQRIDARVTTLEQAHPSLPPAP